MNAPVQKGPPRRVRTPTVLQMEAMESGAAALAIVLGYHGRFVPLEELRLACGVSRDGTSTSKIVRAAGHYGLEAKEIRAQPADLGSLPLPQIAVWNAGQLVVVEGFGKGRVYLNDPAYGPRAVSEAEFNEGFGGVVLVLAPASDFKPGGARPGLLGPLRRRLAGSETGLLFAVLVSLLLTLTGLVVPVFSQVFVDHVLVAGMHDWVVPLLVGMTLMVGLRLLLTWLQRAALLRLETKLALTGSYGFFRHVLRLPVEFFTQRYGGEIGHRVEINDRIAHLLSGELAANLLNALTAVLYLGVMLWYDVPLALAGLVLALGNVVVLHALSRRRKDHNLHLLQEQAKQMGTAMAGLQTIETLKASGTEPDFFSRWSGYLAKVMVAGQKMGVYTMILRVVPPLVTDLTAVAVLGLGALRVMQGHLTIGMLVAFQGLVAGLLGPVKQLTELGGSLQEAVGEMTRLDDVLRYPTDPALADGPPTSTEGNGPDRLSGRLELQGISFGYSRFDPPLLADFSWNVKPGARVAVVGSSGSGKTTLARIICGLYQPWSGAVLFDGRPRAKMPRDVLTSSLALVDQDIFLFAGTIREVLTMWDASVPEEDMVRAAKDACIHEDIAARPGGYASWVEEGGANFSGGQRQRLEIARALVGNPSLLVLDEATSALDPATEKHIDDNLRQRGCTCIIVAHRLSTIRDCDEIIVLERGQIVQRGTHAALAAETGGLYRRLIEAC